MGKTTMQICPVAIGVARDYYIGSLTPTRLFISSSPISGQERIALRERGSYRCKDNSQRNHVPNR